MVSAIDDSSVKHLLVNTGKDIRQADLCQDERRRSTSFALETAGQGGIRLNVFLLTNPLAFLRYYLLTKGVFAYQLMTQVCITTVLIF